MLQSPTPLRGSCRSALALLALFAPFSAHAEETSALEPLIVSALRIPQAASTVTSAVTVLDPKELESQGILQLRDALNASPGVISTSTSGQTGAIGALFIRGARTAESLVVIDGVRMNGSGNQLGNLFAASRTYDVGTIEVLRGPQGAIYGGESIGGVLWMETPRGSGSPHGSTSVEAGSFASLATHSMFQGETANLSYYLSGGYEETDNDGPNQHFHQGNTALRVEGKLDSIWTVGTTFRAADSYYENSGSSDDRFDTALSTIYAVGRISDRWTARFNAAYHQEFYDNDSSTGSYSSDLRAGSFSTDHEITLSENLRLLTGAFFHDDSYESEANYPDPLYPYYSLTDKGGSRFGAHSVLAWDAFEDFTTTAALRWEDYDSFGDELTWRVGSIYHIDRTATSIRGGIGTAFRAPTYLDLYYYSESGKTVTRGNPDLNSQSSLGWEIGIDQKIGDHHSIEFTWFRNLIDEAIDSYAFPMPVNLPGKSTTDGLELGIRGNWLDSALNYRLAWTYLHESLSDQPRNAATTSIDWKPTTKSLVGIGATQLSDHSWGGDPIAAYTVARLYGSYQLSEKVKLHARVENAFDADYHLSSFYGTPIKAAGTGFYAGITVDW
ncbi:MAG: TonB-dependent receptor [Verrucomicrobiota bacterium]